MGHPDGDALAGEVAGLENELVLLSRHHLRRGRSQSLDRSAYILLGRLELAGAMTLKELASAFDLDISTVNRQVGALERNGLVERVPDPHGALARRVRPTELGLARLRADRVSSSEGVLRVVEGWPGERVGLLRELLMEFNQGIEELEGQRWPRP